MIRVRFLVSMVAVALLAACSSAPTYKVSDPETVRVLEGPTVKADLTKRPYRTTATTAGATAIAANNVGNSQVGLLMLAVSALDSYAEDDLAYTMTITLLNEKTQTEETEVLAPYLYSRNVPAPGDRVRIIVRADGAKLLANLTKFPKLDAATR